MIDFYESRLAEMYEDWERQWDEDWPEEPEPPAHDE